MGAVGIRRGKTMGRERETEAEEAKARTVEVGRVVTLVVAAVPAVKAQAVQGIPRTRTMRTVTTRTPNQTWAVTHGGGRPG